MCDLSLNRAACKTPDDPSLCRDIDDNWGERGNQRTCHQCPPLIYVAINETRETCWNRLFRVAPDQQEREQKLVPRIGERIERDHRERGQCERDDDARQRLEAACTVHESGIFQFGGNSIEVRDRQPRTERHRAD